MTIKKLERVLQQKFANACMERCIMFWLLFWLSKDIFIFTGRQNSLKKKSEIFLLVHIALCPCAMVEAVEVSVFTRVITCTNKPIGCHVSVVCMLIDR